MIKASFVFKYQSSELLEIVVVVNSIPAHPSSKCSLFPSLSCPGNYPFMQFAVPRDKKDIQVAWKQKVKLLHHSILRLNVTPTMASTAGGWWWLFHPILNNIENRDNPNTDENNTFPAIIPMDGSQCCCCLSVCQCPQATERLSLSMNTSR